MPSSALFALSVATFVRMLTVGAMRMLILLAGGPGARLRRKLSIIIANLAMERAL